MAGRREDPLARYWAKRNFALTSEPRGETAAGSGGALRFVVQKHHATRLHYDFRLELDGVLLSWAVPRGPSFDPKDMRMAIHVEDHPLSYGSFEGTIPPRQYGAGTVIVWDHGTWQPVADPHQGLKDGKLVFELHGHKLFGLWELVRIAKPGDRQEGWLLFKKRDAHARPRSEYDVLSALPDSVIAKPLKSPPGDGSGPPGAVKAPMPATLPPMLASLAAAAPTSGEWSWEIKLDGYRLMARIEGGEIKLITRGGHDWSARMPALVKALRGLGLKASWLDGELVALGADGTPDFNALQNAFDRRRTEATRLLCLRPAVLRRPRPAQGTVGGAARAAETTARRQSGGALALQRRLRCRAGGDAGIGAPHGPGRADRQAQGFGLRIAPQRILAEAEEQAAAGIRRRRLHRPQQRRG